MRNRFKHTLPDLQCLLHLQRDLKETDKANKELQSTVEAKISVARLLGQDGDISHEVTPKDVQTLALICRDRRCLILSIKCILDRELYTLRELIDSSFSHLEFLVQIKCFMIKENLITDGKVLKKKI